jgi:hypothetical protein
MRAVFEKQLRDAALPCALLVVLTLLAFETGREFDLTRRPGTDGTAPFVAFAWGLAGVALGFLSAAGDEVRGTHPHLFHRGLGRARIFWARTAGDAVALAVALALVVAVDGALAALRHDAMSEPPPSYARYAEPALTSCAAFLGRGLGSVGGAMRHAAIVRLFCAAYGACGAIYLTFVAMRDAGDRWLSNEVLWLAWTLGGGAALHVLGARMQAQPHDSERPLRGRTRSVFGSTALVIAAPATLLTVALVQRWTLETAVNGMATIGIHEGRVLVRPPADAPSTPALQGVLFDPARAYELNYEEAGYFFVARKQHVLELGADWRPLVGKRRWIASPTGAFFSVQTWIGARNGRILAQAVRADRPAVSSAEIEPAPLGLELPFRRELSRSDGLPFSQQVLLLPPPKNGDGWLLADASDRTLWRLGMQSALPTLDRVELAKGEVWTGVDVAMNRAVVEVEGRNSRRSSTRTVLVTSRGRMRWDGERLDPAQLEESEVWRSEASEALRFAVELVDADVLTPRVRMRDARSGAVLLEHGYATPAALGLVAHLASTLRSPAGGILATLGGEASRPQHLEPVRDPLVAGGRRTWLLAINVSVSLALALVFARRRALGLRTGWFAFFALFGPLTALLAGALEPRRLKTGPPPTRTALRIAARPTRAQREAVVG